MTKRVADRTPEERERARAYQAAYRLAHREERRAYQAAYDLTHREERRAYQAAYRPAHREERRAYQAAHRQSGYGKEWNKFKRELTVIRGVARLQRKADDAGISL